MVTDEELEHFLVAYMQSAPGRTRTCATGSGGRSGLSRPSLSLDHVSLNRISRTGLVSLSVPYN